jgi:leucyl-tRNA synthetase
MSLVNVLTKEKHVNIKDYEMFLSIVYPFAPHICEELWAKLGHNEDMVYAPWPTYDETKLIASTIQIVVSINGKVKDKLTISVNMSKDEVLELAKQTAKIKILLEGKTIRKEIYVPNKLVNLVAN